MPSVRGVAQLELYLYVSALLVQSFCYERLSSPITMRWVDSVSFFYGSTLYILVCTRR